MAKSKKTKKKVVIKKRFYVICLVFLLLVGTGIFFAAKAIINIVSMNSPSLGENISQDEGGDSVAIDDSSKNDKDTSQFADVTPAVMVEEQSTEGKNTEGEENPLSIEQSVKNSVLSSWYISPLGQQRATIEQGFGKLIRKEEWNGELYYHTKFAETMYITYDSKKGEDEMPIPESVCKSVSIALKKIMEYEEFKPSSVWGEINQDKSGYGWTDYFYSVLIKDNINMIIYCDEEGNVDSETHIIVRLV